MMLFFDRRRALIGSNEYFPPDPGNYPNLEKTFTSSGTFTAPRTGWYEVQVYGATQRGGYRNISGTLITDPYESGNPEIDGYYSSVQHFYNGAGGGSGGYASSHVKLNEGDTIVVTVGAGPCSAAINSSVTEEYETITVSLGSLPATGDNIGSGGKASGGNYQNINGNPGTPGGKMTGPFYTRDYSLGDMLSTTVGQGGAAVVPGGNPGSKGAETTLKVVRYQFTGSSATQTCFEEIWTAMGTAKAGFCKIYSGS